MPKISQLPAGATADGTEKIAAVQNGSTVYLTSKQIADEAVGTTAQPLDSDLTAIAALSTTAFGRSLLALVDASAARTTLGVDIGTNVQAYDADLSALAGNATNGFWVRTGEGVGQARTLTGTANQIAVSDGNGVAGNPTISLTSPVIAPGTGTALSTDPTFVAARAITTYVVGGAHPFSDNSTYNVAGGSLAAASFDAVPQVIGTFNYDHFAGFQSRVAYQSSGTVTSLYGHVDIPGMVSGTVTNRYGVSIWDVIRAGGTLTNNYGIYIKELLEGATRFAIYTEGATPSRFNGSVSFGAALTPVADDGGALGTTALKFSDLFLASGGVINFNNGDVTITHSADVITVAGGQLLNTAQMWSAFGTAPPAGGIAGMFVGSTALAIGYGSGLPTFSAAQGSIYLRTDGSSSSTRLYVNTNGSTGWTNVVTAT